MNYENFIGNKNKHRSICKHRYLWITLMTMLIILLYLVISLYFFYANIDRQTSDFRSEFEDMHVKFDKIYNIIINLCNNTEICL